MPNISTHPPRSRGKAAVPVQPIKAAPGEIPFTVLEIPHTWNRDVLCPKQYQAGYQRFQPKELNRSDDLIGEIRSCIRSDDVELDDLRHLYNKVLADERGKYKIPTRLMRDLTRKIEVKFTDNISGAVDTSDIDGLESLLEMVDEDHLLRMIIKRVTDLDAIKALVPEVKAGHTAKMRDTLDAGGSHRQSTYKRASNAELMRDMRRDMVEGFEHITFNPETGRLQLVTEILYEKRASMFMRDSPTAMFQDPTTAREALDEIAKVYQIFQVPFCVVQVHKSPYKSKGADGGEHEGWLHELAFARAEKMRQELVKKGVPPEVITAKAEVVSKTVVMQYCEFDMRFNHISFDSKTSKIALRAPIMWEKRLYSRDQQDIPDAQFAEPEEAQKVVLEVLKIAKFYGCEMDVVVHKSYTTTFDDEHKQWLDELLDNRAERVKDELADLGLKEDLVGSRVESIEEEGMGIHFELMRNMGATRTMAAGPKGPDHVLEVEGSGQFEFNGKYRPGGESHGKPKYRHEKGGKETITFGSCGFWYMCYNHNTAKGIYKSRELANNEPWKHTQTSNTGMVPVVRMIKLHDGVASSRTDKVEVHPQASNKESGEENGSPRYTSSEASGSAPGSVSPSLRTKTHNTGTPSGSLLGSRSGSQLSVHFATDA